MQGVSEYELRALVPDITSSIAFISSNPPFTPFGQVDAEVLALCRWFKDDYMRWVDPIKCPTCDGPTFSAGTVPPDGTEHWEGASRVELHVCKDKNCAAQRRFPRYGKVSTLLRTREGRCGEWAHLFYVFLRAKGIESRYVWNRFVRFPVQTSSLRRRTQRRSCLVRILVSSSSTLGSCRSMVRTFLVMITAH